MASLSLYPQFKTNLMSNRKVIELLLQLKSAKAHGKNYIKVKPPGGGVMTFHDYGYLPPEFLKSYPVSE